jgi:hypothetical protein
MKTVKKIVEREKGAQMDIGAVEKFHGLYQSGGHVRASGRLLDVISPAVPFLVNFSSDNTFSYTFEFTKKTNPHTSR